MQAQLEIQGLLSVLKEEETSTSKEEKLEDSEEIKQDPKKAAKDLRVRSLLSIYLSDVILRKIMNEPTALGMWRALERDYQTKSLPNKIYLKKKFSCFKMEEEKPMEENFDQFLKVIADLASIKIDISDEDQAIQLLSGLPSAYEPLVHTLQYGTGKDTLTVNEVMTAAYSKEVELKQKGMTPKGRPSEVLFSESRGRLATRNESGGNKPWHNKSKNRFRSKSRGKTANKTDKTCWICGSEGHWKRDCLERKKFPQNNRPQSSANIATNLPGPVALTASLTVSQDEWVMDSWCTFHITPRKELLSKFEEFEGNKVMMGNNTHCMVRGMGKITIDNLDETMVTLSNVRYIHEMGRNLISYGQLEQSGCSYSGQGFMIHFYKGDKRVLSGKYTSGLYYLQGNVRKTEVNSVKETMDLTRR